MTSSTWLAAASGLGLSLIIAIGAQNTLVLRQGLGREHVGPVVAVCAASDAVLTWLNPHVYLDTVVLLGSVAATHGGARWWFAAGAITGSVVWFVVLGAGARLLRPLFARPAAWRVLDAGVAVVMTVLALGLVLGS